MVPDVHPGEGMKQAFADGDDPGEMNMTAADFIVLYSTIESKASFDAVATMFFIDTAPNLVRYVDTVSNCLRGNGIWINVGPLLWHSDAAFDAKADEEPKHQPSVFDGGSDAGIGEQGSFELTEEEVIWLLERRGFHIEHRGVSAHGVGYIQDPDSLFQNLYRVACWVARKTD